MPIEHVFVASGQSDYPVYRLIEAKHIPCYVISEGILKKISDTSYLIPLLGVARLPAQSETTTRTKGELVVVLDRVLDHGNIGTIIRTASAFGIHDLVSTTSDLDIHYKKIVSASRGRVFAMHVQRYTSGVEAVNALKAQGYQVVATSPHARYLQAQVPLQAKPIALVVGNETDGIDDDVVRNADVVVQIPMNGFVESLNVGVATGISLYELKFRMVLMLLTKYIRQIMGRQVNVTGQMIMRAFEVQVQRVTDLSAMHIVLLMMLKCDGSMTSEQMSKDVALFGDDLTQFLEPLLSKGYICTSQQPGDPAPYITTVLTDEGERALAQLWGIVEQAEQEVLAGFSEYEKEQFNAYLLRIQENCTRIIS
jgi:TrmH family RNA methyltransferase